MGLFILSETSAGYALFKATDKKLLKREDYGKELETAADAANLYDTRSLLGEDCKH